MDQDKYKLDVVSIRMVKEPPLFSDKKISTPGDAVEILGDMLSDYDREVMAVVNLKSDMTPINVNIVSIGSVNASLAHPREIMKSAILSNAAYMVLVHNHPSGNLAPSTSDIEVTDQMCQIGYFMQIPVLDHIIIGRNHEYYSFVNKEILPIDKIDYAKRLEDLDMSKKPEVMKESVLAKLHEKENLVKNAGKKRGRPKKTKVIEKE